MICIRCGKKASKCYVHRRVEGPWKHVGYYCRFCGKIWRQ